MDFEEESRRLLALDSQLASLRAQPKRNDSEPPKTYLDSAPPRAQGDMDDIGRERPTNRSGGGLAVLSLVAGMLSFLTCPVAGAVTAIVAGKMADRRTLPESRRSLASAGVMLGAANLAICFVAAAGIIGFGLHSSTERGPIRLPDVVGSDFESATRILRAAGYEQVNFTYAYGDFSVPDVPRSKVCQQTPGPGIAASTSTVVQLILVHTGNECP